MDGFAVDLDKVLDDFEESEVSDILPVAKDVSSSNVPVAPPNYNDITHEATSMQYPTRYYGEERTSGIPKILDTDLMNPPFAGVFDTPHGADLGRTMHRLEQIVTVDYTNQEICKPNADEGHFIPDDAGQDITDGPFGYDPGIYNTQTIGMSEPFSNEHLFDTPNSQEILQAATELQAHIGGKEDRPSFMSSSPPVPSFHHPDVIASSCSTDSSQASNENQSDSGVSSEQGETGITNTYTNTSPVHRSNPVDASNVVHSLEQIAQNSYTVPLTSDDTYQFSPDSFAKEDMLYNLNSDKHDSYGAHNSTVSGSGDTEATCSQLQPSNSAECDSNITSSVSQIQNNLIADNPNGSDITYYPDYESLSSGGTVLSLERSYEMNPQENVEALSLQPITNDSKVIEDTIQEDESSLQLIRETLQPVESVTNAGIESECVHLIDSIPSKCEEPRQSSLQSYQETPTCDVSSTELPKTDNVQTELDIVVVLNNDAQKRNELVTENMPDNVASEFCDKLGSETGDISEQSIPGTSQEIESKQSEVCDATDLSVLEKFTVNQFPLSEIDFTSAMSQAASELAELEKEIGVLQDKGVVVANAGNTSQNTATSDTRSDLPVQSVPLNDNDVCRDAMPTQMSTETSSTTTLMQSTQVSTLSSPSSTLTTPASPDVTADVLKQRRDSGESVERFLAPSVMSPGIATPMDDPGFTKVPGYQPALDSTTEEDDQSGAKGTKPSLGSLTDVRPKEGTPERSRKSRPNSLLGLSKPDLPVARVLQESGSENLQETRSINPMYEATRTGQLETNIATDDVFSQQEIAGDIPGMNSGGNVPGTDVMSPVLDVDHSILRPKTFVPPQTLPGIASRSDNAPTSLNLQFPASNIHHPQRPASWPVQDAQPVETLKQRRPNSLNIPSRGGSVSPSQPTQEFVPEITTLTPTVDEMSLTDEAVGVPVTGRPLEGVDSATEAMEGAVAPLDTAMHAQVLSTSTSRDSLITIPTIASSARTPGAVLPPQSSSNPLLSITDLGKIAPTWIPDAEAPNCMECELKFTFTKRRHHCRACGKVFCSSCCYLKSKLQYIESKEARVCSKCYQDLIRAIVFERMSSEEGATGGGSNPPTPNPNNPSEYCSTIPPLQQAQANAPPPSVMVPVGVLRKEGSFKRESKKVIFSDGIRPGGDLTELDGSAEIAHPPPRPSRRSKTVERSSDSLSSKTNAQSVKPTKAPIVNMSHVPHTGLPPVFKGLGPKGEFIMEPSESVEAVMAEIATGDNPVQFVVNKNLVVLVKLVTMDCCIHRTCWCFTSKGMCTVGQDEIVILLEIFPGEECLPVDIFSHFHSVYEDASKGEPVSNMDHTLFTHGFLDSRDHGGFLYLRPTFQCLNKLIIPDAPYVFGVLLQKWETPWAKVFPVRLLLRLGAEFRYYPCPLVSVRFRKPVFGEIGHTIMNLLVDFRNFQYMIPHVRGFTIYMKDKKTYLNLPRNRYEDVTRALSSSTEQVLALAASFSKQADSYLVCIQNEDGNYQTQAINIHNKAREVTGASFAVFNANLKTSGGVHAKSSIVEDGLMVQILPETMIQLRNALKEMRDYCIEYGGANPNDPEESVVVQWVDNDKDFNVGVVSPIDKFPMDGVADVHIHNAVDYIGSSYKAIRWTQVFFLQTNAENARIEPVDMSRLAETLSTALSVALTPKLDRLSEAGLLRIGLRARIDNENVGYEVGSNGEKLPDYYMNDLDNELIPVIHNAAAHNRDGAVIVELIFHIINI